MHHTHGSPFSGLPSSTSHPPSWSSSSFHQSGTSFNPHQSGFGGGEGQRSMYQSGYLMSARHPPTDPSPHSASHSTPPTGETPAVATKAKMNHSVLTRDPFGMDSMFSGSESASRSIGGHGRRHGHGGGQGMDEDAPPMRSVNDLEEEMFGKAGEGRTKQIPADSPFFARRFAPTSRPASTPNLNASTPASTPAPATPTLYVVVFGYPPGKFDATAEYFKALCASSSNHNYRSRMYDDQDDEAEEGSGRQANGPCTDAEANTEVLNCFRIGYRDAGDAMRAVRKNGEVIGGSWMVGVKWADPTLAESLLGTSNLNNSSSFLSQEMDTSSPPPPPNPSSSSSFFGSSFRSDPQSPPAENNALVPIGTPMRLAPSSSAFRVGTPGAGTPAGKLPAPAFGTTPNTPNAFASGQGQSNGQGHGQASPNKGMLGQVSDLIFGW